MTAKSTFLRNAVLVLTLSALTATAADARSLFRSKRSRTNTAAAIALGMAAYTLYNGYNTYREDAAGRPYLR